MAGTSPRMPVATLVVAGVCLAGAIGLQHARDRFAPPVTRDDSFLYIRSGAAMSRLALGFDALLADVYWIRAVQYFGGQTLAERARRPRDLLYPLLDITTTLDPRFNIAYRFGAIFVAEGYPDGPGRPDLAQKLLEKGFAANPTRWEYLHDIAFVHYWWLRDYAGASEWFTKASRVPGSPEWLPGLAAITLTRGGDRRSARFLWRQIYEHSEHGYMRRTAEHRLVQLDIMDQIDTLDALLARVRADTGRQAAWSDLAARGWIRHDPPRDPAGIPYEIDRPTGRVVLSPSSPYFPLPVGMPNQPRPPGSRSSP